ncbi:hypothetical protein [Arthrobacter sp. SLBN-53]|uniref:hypothetical protein n=1 Tax=Arthrobacter sp. SLBN-53 TaxID=2768412 RepID=UPI0011509C5E|nr:hypothetical protein [Arthrobacter sp. SLBN-53]TQK29365.1 hypothetical protein FBY28_2368 [Arthrobacter sp. SLBN-53]
MALPNFTIDTTTKLYAILGSASAGVLAPAVLAKTRVVFSSNIPVDGLFTFEGNMYRAATKVYADVGEDGSILQDGFAVRLLANDDALSISNIQWTVTILAPTPAGAQEILPWTFDAPGNGAVVDLSETVAVTAVEAVGVMRGPKGDPVDDFTVIDGWLQFYVKGTPVGAPKKLEFGSAEWSTILGKPDVIAAGGTEAEARAAIDAVGAQEVMDALAGTASGLQPKDADLTALAALPTVANRLPYATGPSAWSLTEFSPFGRSVAALADAPALRVLAGLRIGTDVQAHSAALAALAAMTNPVAGSTLRVPLFSDSGSAWNYVNTTGFGRGVFGLADAAAARTMFGAMAASLVGVANGVAPLDENGTVAPAYLPSYVDDVIERATLAAFPAVGETGKIYTALNAGTSADPSKIYRWSGSTYVEISPSPGSTDAVPEGATNLYFTNARADARADLRVAAGITGKADKATTIAAGTGLTGGGDLSANRSLAVAYGTTAGTAAQGNDARLSNARPPTAHSHNVIVPIEYEVHATYSTRAVGYGDNTLGFLVPSAFTLASVVFRGETADASGSTTVEIRKNGTQLATTVKTITAANQWGYDTDIIVTGLSESLVAGDILRPYISAVGTTPGKGLSVTLIGTKTVATS